VNLTNELRKLGVQNLGSQNFDLNRELDRAGIRILDHPHLVEEIHRRERLQKALEKLIEDNKRREAEARKSKSQ